MDNKQRAWALVNYKRQKTSDAITKKRVRWKTKADIEHGGVAEEETDIVWEKSSTECKTGEGS